MLENCLADAIGKASCLAVLLIDVDHFKLVNDRHGHLRGDRVLAHIAEGLAACLRQGDALVRFGGEEFLVVLPATELASATAQAEALRARIDQMPRLPGLQQHVTISVGVCTLSQLRQPAIEALLGGADERCMRPNMPAATGCASTRPMLPPRRCTWSTPESHDGRRNGRLKAQAMVYTVRARPGNGLAECLDDCGGANG